VKFRTSDVLSVSTGTLLPHAENTDAKDNVIVVEMGEE